MKTRLYKLFVGVLVLCSAISCQVEEISSEDMSKDVNNVFTFFAEGAENQTKTIRQDDGTVWWDSAENIKIFCKGISGKFTSDNAEPAASTTFTGSFESKITLDDIAKKGVMALYPYQDDAKSDGSSVTFSVPSEQIAVKGTFGKDLFPCIATSKGTNLSFYNVCSGIKFSVVNDDIRSVTFKTSEDEPIAGMVEVDYFWDDMPSVKVKKGVSEVTVYAPDNGYFEPGEFYYITILPPPAPTYIFWDGFTMIYNKDDVSDSITIDENVPLPRSKFGVIEGKDEGLLFIDYNQNIEFADPIMKEMCVNAFDTDGDGELSIGEAKVVESLSKMKLTNKTFKYFDEFKYFINVSSVPSGYFEDSHLQSIILPAYLKRINSQAFKGCVNLKSIEIPNGMEYIGSSAFESCSRLSGILELPDSLKTIENAAFRFCKSIEEVILPNGLLSIGVSAFQGCTNLKSINLPSSLTTIGGYAFYNCSSLSGSLVIPEGVTKLEDRTFYNCLSFEEVILPESLLSIGVSAFSGCTNLKSINLPSSLTSIEYSAFYNCLSLEEVILPESLLSIGGGAFQGCTNLKSINLPSSLTSIGNSAFYDCLSLEEVILPESLLSIGGDAFQGCTNLKSINLPSSLTSIGNSAFYDCSSLSGSLVIPEGVTKLEDKTFYKCTSLEEVTLSKGLLSIGGSAFSGCTNLKSINLPSSLTSIGNSAFYDCSSLSGSHVIPEGVTKLEDKTFYKCTSLEEVILSKGLLSIGGSAFSGCTNLKSINLPSSLTSIGNSAFYNCSSLSGSLVIPEGVTKLGDWTFYKCTSLEEVTLPDGLLSIGDGAFWGCSNLKGTIILPEGIEDLNFAVFGNCTNVEEFVLPMSLVSIKAEAFYQCTSIKKVHIPECVSEIGKMAFSVCNKLETIMINCIIPPTIAEDTFAENNYKRKFYVPIDAIERYLQAEVWKTYAKRIEGYDFENDKVVE